MRHKIIQGAKAGSGSTRQAVVASDSAQSKTYLKLQYGLSEGEIFGLVNGGQSIYLDDTPILDASGNTNFKGLTWDFRTGTNDQTYMEGFPEVSNETEVNVELKDNAWVRSLSNTQINAVRLRLKWGALRTTDASNGDVSGVTIRYAIDLSTDGGAYQTVLETQISDKTSDSYERPHRIELPVAHSGWNIRVRRLTPPRNSDYVSDKMYIASYAEVIDAKFRYPNTALLGLQYDAENFSGVAKIAVRAKGIKVLVPSNYDPEAGTYTGFWDGSFKRAYSNNPAWIYYDLCTAKRYGLGQRITPKMLDKASLYRLAQYCDEWVSDGAGGQEPRFTCNVYIQSAEDAYTILGKLAGVFRAISYWDGDSIVCDADIPQDVFYNYTNANVVDGNFEYSGTRNRDRHTVAKVAWSNPDNRFKTEYEIVRDENAIAKHQVKTVEISAWGCTSRGQAQRAGLWALRSEQYETQTVSFKVGLDGQLPVPGKVISVADNDYAGRFIGGRVQAITDDGIRVTLDREVQALPGDKIYINTEQGQSVTRVIKALDGTQVTVTQAFDAHSIASQNAWTIDSTVLKTRKFRVMSIKQDEEHQFSITALEYNAQKYDAIDNGAYIQNVPISIINPTSQDAVKNVTLSSYDQVQQGLNIANLVIAWDKADYAVKYLVEWKKDDGSWIKMPMTGNTSLEIQGVYAGQYLARITAFSAFDVASLATTSQLTAIQGKQGKPPKLAFLRATGTMFGMKLNWGFPQTGALDTAYTEIEYSTTENGAESQLLGAYAYPTDQLQQQGLSGHLTLWYRGRLVDRIGNQGEWSGWMSGTSTAQVSDILDALSDQLTKSQLDQDLRTQIEKIEGLDGDVGNIINRVNEVQQTADSALSKAQQEAQDRANAVQNLQESLDQEGKQRTTAISNLNDGLTEEQTARKNADESILNTVTTYKSSTDQSITAAQTSIDLVTTAQTATAKKLDGVYAKVMPITADSTSLTADSNSNQASSWTVQSAIADGDSALGQRIDVTQAQVASHKALIQSEQTARSDADSALATRIDTVTASTANNASLIQQEVKARSDADTTLTQQINTAQSTADNAKALITSESSTRASADTALGQRIDTISVKANDNAASIVQEQNARANADSANAKALSDYKSQNDKAVAGATLSINTLTTQQKAQSDKLDGVYAKVTPITVDSTTLTADSMSNQASSWSIQSAIVDGDNALSQRIDLTQAQIRDADAIIKEERTARATENSALAKQITTVQTTLNGNTASIQEQKEVTDGLSARASLKLDVNGTIGGVSVGNDGKTVDAIFRTNTFAIAPPATADDQTPAYAFVYRSTATTLANGTVVPKGLYLDSAYIGQIDANKINAESLSAISANLGDIEVGSAHIADGAINTAKILDLSVDTIKIKDGAINNFYSTTIDCGNRKENASGNPEYKFDLWGLESIPTNKAVTVFFSANISLTQEKISQAFDPNAYIEAYIYINNTFVGRYKSIESFDRQNSGDADDSKVNFQLSWLSLESTRMVYTQLAGNSPNQALKIVFSNLSGAKLTFNNIAVTINEVKK